MIRFVQPFRSLARVASETSSRSEHRGDLLFGHVTKLSMFVVDNRPGRVDYPVLDEDAPMECLLTVKDWENYRKVRPVVFTCVLRV